MSQHLQGVVFFPPGVIILLLNIGQLHCQVPNPVVHASKVLYLCAEAFILLLADGKVNHEGEGLSRVECISFLAYKDPSRVQVLCHS
jgi:hypothetical protein